MTKDFYTTLKKDVPTMILIKRYKYLMKELKKLLNLL